MGLIRKREAVCCQMLSTVWANTGRWIPGAMCLCLILAGCGHKEVVDVPEPPLTGLMAPRPPVLLTGPVAFLVTNASGFSARVTAAGFLPGK
jgi:hypothetical protein